MCKGAVLCTVADISALQIFAALKDFSTGGEQATSLDFSGSNYFDNSALLAKTLDSVQAKHPIRFHECMHQLFNLWCGPSYYANLIPLIPHLVLQMLQLL